MNEKKSCDQGLVGQDNFPQHGEENASLDEGSDLRSSHGSGGAGQRILDNFRGFSTTRPPASAPMSAEVLLQRLGIRMTSDGQGPTKVDLSHKCITAHEARILAEPLAQNRVVCLKLGYNQLRDAGTVAVARVLDHHPTLETLDLGFNDIGDEGAVALGTSLCSNRVLITLYLSGNRIGLAGIQALCAALESNHTLGTLHLTGNPVGAPGAQAVAAALESQQRALTVGTAHKGLERLYLSGAQLGTPGALSIARTLSSTSNLTELYLSDNGVGDKGAAALGMSFAVNQKIRLIELAFNNIGPSGVEALLSGVNGHPSLTNLNLGNNHIGDRGAQLVARCLSFTILDSLDLGFNSIGTPGTKELMQAVLNSPTLQTLILSGNGLDSEGAKALAYALRYSATLTHLYIDHTGISLGGERHIAAGLMGNQQLQLKRFTGFRLGAAVVSVSDRIPKPVEELTNDQVLAYLRQPWEFQQENCDVESPTNPKAGEREGTRRLLSNRQERQRSSSAPLRLLSSKQVPGDGTSKVEETKVQRRSSVDETQNPSKQQQDNSFLSIAMNENYLQSLQQISQIVYNATELWELHQYFFSPPPTVHPKKDIPNQDSSIMTDGLLPKDSAKDSLEADPNLLYQHAALTPSDNNVTPLSPGKAVPGSHDNDEMTDVDRPSKRLCAAIVRMRIAYYPRIQEHLNILKNEQNQEKILILLRQLKYLEAAAAKKMFSGEHPNSDQIFQDIEAVILEML